MRHTLLRHQFVQHIPDSLEPGVLYISVHYGTAAHRCCCGCGEEVVTPFTPTDWRMTFDGETISLWPSIGNWNLACRSHYIINWSRVLEADPWTQEQIDQERRRDKDAKARFFGISTPHREPNQAPPSVSTHSRSQSLWETIRRWFSG